MAFIPSASSSGGGSSIIKTGYGGFGQPAKYVFISHTSGYLSMHYFDQDFGQIVPQMNHHTLNNPSSGVNAHSGHYYIHTGNNTYVHKNQTAYAQHSNMASNSNQGSSSAYPVMSACMMSMVGSPYAGHYSDGSMHDAIAHPAGETVNDARKIYNSDHTDKTINYSIGGDRLRAKDIGGPMSNNDTTAHDAVGTQPQQMSSLSGSLALGFSIPSQQSHHASYNLKRKELIVFGMKNAGIYTCTIYTGIDFDANPSPKAAFAAAGVGKQTHFDVTLPNWAVNDNETYYNVYMVLCNDGGVRVATWQKNNGFKNYRFTPPTNGAALDATYIGQTTGTTSYGADSGNVYGTSMLQTVDRKTVCVMAPYYYYHSGCMAFILDKVNSNSTVIDIQDTSSGNSRYLIPYRDDGFALFKSDNNYSSNYTAGTIQDRITRISSLETGSLANLEKRVSLVQYMTKYLYPNTTNYPMLIPVTDYHSHPYNYGARSHAL